MAPRRFCRAAEIIRGAFLLAFIPFPETILNQLAMPDGSGHGLVTLFCRENTPAQMGKRYKIAQEMPYSFHFFAAFLDHYYECS